MIGWVVLTEPHASIRIIKLAPLVMFVSAKSCSIVNVSFTFFIVVPLLIIMQSVTPTTKFQPKKFHFS